MKIFNYRYRWYTWLSRYSRVMRLLIVLLPSFFMVIGWYFLYYKPIVIHMNMLIQDAQKSSKELASFHILQNKVVELKRELELFTQEEQLANVASLHERIFGVLEGIEVSVIEFQQNSKKTGPNVPLTITMKLAGSSDAVLKILNAFKDHALLFAITLLELNHTQNTGFWTINLQGQLFN